MHILYFFFKSVVLPMDLSISYSSLSTFKKSPLEYYFYKIAKIPPIAVNSCYGDAGNAVHNALEHYIKTSDQDTADLIFTEKINKLPEKGMFGETINTQKFRDSFLEGIRIIEEWKQKGYELTAEEKFELTETIEGVQVTIRGYVDCIAKKTLTDGSVYIHILDWKTNSSLPSDGFKGQQEFYTYLYYKKHKTLPRHFHWYMLKTGGKVEHYYEMKTVKKIEKELAEFVKYIKERGNNVSLYEPGEYNHPFNNFYEACQKEVDRRQTQTILEAVIHRNRIKLKNITDRRLTVALDKLFSYDAEGHQYSDKYMDGTWDGRIHFLKVKKEKQVDNDNTVTYHTLPIGFYWMLQDFLEKYNQRFALNYKIIFEDQRNKQVQDIDYNTKFKERSIEKGDFDLRYYQHEAVAKVIEKRIGILALCTSSGKSAVTAEALKQINKRGLVIVNRLELVEQTADALEDYLGVRVGRMYEGTLDVKSQFTVASVQTISALLDRKDIKPIITYLFNVNVLFFDECQNVTDKGFYNKILKYLVNASYIVGLSGSAWRNYEPETLSMKALVGDIIYSKTTAELEAEGFICPTKCYFVRPHNRETPTINNYHDAYDFYITKNEVRNKLVIDIVNKYRDTKKILILTKLIEHGKTLSESIHDSILINSHTKTKDRKESYGQFQSERGFVLIGSQQIFATGVNIPDLDMIINVSASKSSIMAIQSIGRVKRKYPGKKVGYYIDFFDNDCEMFSSGSWKRMKLLEDHGNETNIAYSLDEVFKKLPL